MEIGVSGPIFTQKISTALWYNNIHTLQNGENIVAMIPIYGARAITTIL